MKAAWAGGRVEARGGEGRARLREGQSEAAVLLQRHLSLHVPPLRLWNGAPSLYILTGAEKGGVGPGDKRPEPS